MKNPLLEKYWPMVIERSRAHGLLGASLAQARHLLEVAWGSSTWEVPQSAVCDQPAFFRFTAHLLAQMPRFLPIYNAAVGEYRRMHRIRNRAHPVPDLAVEGDWLEAPFWIWTAENPRRRRLFVRSSGRETILSDRRNIEAEIVAFARGRRRPRGRAIGRVAAARRQNPLPRAHHHALGTFDAGRFLHPRHRRRKLRPRDRCDHRTIFRPHAAAIHGPLGHAAFADRAAIEAGGRSDARIRHSAN